MSEASTFFKPSLLNFIGALGLLNKARSCVQRVDFFGAEIMHNYCVRVSGKCTVAYLLFTYSAHLLLCNNALYLLMQDPFLLNPQKLGMKKILEYLIESFLLGIFFKDFF